ncbi:MAG: hypothetical protein HYR67_08140 [Bacteroidetes bacterium]|nr:hypothetical protein [Bacteroidota bacterium]
MTKDEAIQEVMAKMHGSDAGDVLVQTIHDWIKGVSDSFVMDLITRMKSEDLIINFGSVKGNYRLSSKGALIHENSGWLKFLVEEQDKKEIDYRLKRSTIETNDSVKVTNYLSRRIFKFTFLISTFTFIVSLLGTYVAWLSYKQSKQILNFERNDKFQQQKLVDSIDMAKSKIEMQLFEKAKRKEIQDSITNAKLH